MPRRNPGLFFAEHGDAAGLAAMVRDAPLRGAPHHEVGFGRTATHTDLILRSGRKDRVSKDGARSDSIFKQPPGRISQRSAAPVL
jgi:hypothetical protein